MRVQFRASPEIGRGSPAVVGVYKTGWHPFGIDLHHEGLGIKMLGAFNDQINVKRVLGHDHIPCRTCRH
ncbi:MAG TPA: hypothetical protein VJM81_07175 [Rhizorhapis sp.]|nr:hypothetical protein [Rhizorhapis sp.]